MVTARTNYTSYEFDGQCTPTLTVVNLNTLAQSQTSYHGLQSALDRQTDHTFLYIIRAFNGRGQFSATDERKFIAQTMDSLI